MSRKKKRNFDNNTKGQNPFDELAELTGLVAEEPPETIEELAASGDEKEPSDETPSSDVTPSTVIKTSKRGQKNMKRGRIEILRQNSGSGKALTVAKGFAGIPLQEKKELAKKIQKVCGVGGTVKDGCIEIQGDNREAMMRILTEAGFNPVFAGG